MQDQSALRPVAEHLEDVDTAPSPDVRKLSASARVFGIGELVEQILIDFAKARCIENWAFSLPMRPIKELFVLQRVNQKFALAIRSSAPLRRYMLLEPVTDPPKMEVAAAWKSGCGLARQTEDPLDWLIFELNIAWSTKYICPPDAQDIAGVTIYVLKSIAWHQYDRWCKDTCRYIHMSRESGRSEGLLRT
ncbi:hypothetical protein AC579_7438 [Pseudocercospora musae]|uniref:Uncharacterized protein n=1 Tax=Pseudocercospora musae TaxID=113226 RepID=A0A139IQD5_9PEZI|nr:hypothetical protein AC579_7438 [Pseudocercospora musae]